MRYAGRDADFAWVEGDAGPDAAEPAPAMKFPGCDPVSMTWDDVEAYDGRIE